MKKEELIFNILLGLSVISWGIAGFHTAYVNEGLSVVRILTACFNLLIGILIISRRPVHTSGSFLSFLLCLPSLVFSGLLFHFSAPFTSWRLAYEILFGCGALLATVSFFALGQNFAILPQLRNVTTGGLYRLVRHPAYLGEILMLLACLLSGPKLINSIALLFLFPF